VNFILLKAASFFEIALALREPSLTAPRCAPRGGKGPKEGTVSSSDDYRLGEGFKRRDDNTNRVAVDTGSNVRPAGTGREVCLGLVRETLTIRRIRRTGGVDPLVPEWLRQIPQTAIAQHNICFNASRSRVCSTRTRHWLAVKPVFAGSR